MPVDEGFSVTPTTSVPTSGLDLAKLASGRVVEARVASVVEGIALVASRHGTLSVDVAAFGRQAPAAGDTVRLQVQAIDGGGKPSFTVIEHSAAVNADPSAAGARPIEDPVLVLARAVRGAAANQTGLAPLYATLAGLRAAPAGTVPEQVRTLVAQLMSGRLAAASPPTAEAVRKAFLGSGLFLETRLAATPGVRAAPADDLKAALFSLRAALEKWVGPAAGATAATAGGAPAPAAPAASAPGGSAAPSTGTPTAARPGGSTDPSGGRPAGSAGSGTPADVGSRGPVGRLIGAAYGGGTNAPASPYAPSGAAPAAGRPPVASPAGPGAPPSPAGTVSPSLPASAVGSGAMPTTTGAPPVVGQPIAGSTGPAAPLPGSEPAVAGRPVATAPLGVAGTPVAASPSALAPAIDPGRTGVAPIPGAASPPGATGTPATPSGPKTAGASPTPAPPSAVPTPPVATPTPVAGLGPPAAGGTGLVAGASSGAALFDSPVAPPQLGGPATNAADVAPPNDELGLAAPPTPIGVPVAGPPADAAEDGVALLLRAVVRGLEIAGSLTAPRPNEAGEVAAALAGIGPERELKPPPPRRGQAPRGQTALADERIGDDGVEGLGRRALERTEGALSRILLEQFAALDRRADDSVAAADGRTTREWTAELPLATTGGTGVVQMTVERDGGRERGGPAAAKPAWRVRFSMDVEPLGPVHAQIGLTGDKLSIGLWAERPDAAARLGGDVGRLQGALEAAAIPVESIHLATGRPTTNAAAPTAGRFVDVKL